LHATREIKEHLRRALVPAARSRGSVVLREEHAFAVP
jgi:hypothetical protein